MTSEKALRHLYDAVSNPTLDKIKDAHAGGWSQSKLYDYIREEAVIKLKSGITEKLNLTRKQLDAVYRDLRGRNDVQGLMMVFEAGQEAAPPSAYRQRKDAKREARFTQYEEFRTLGRKEYVRAYGLQKFQVLVSKRYGVRVRRKGTENRLMNVNIVRKPKRGEA